MAIELKCENNECKSKGLATHVLRLNSFHGYSQCPARLGDRTPAKIAVCKECAIYLCNYSELKWACEHIEESGITDNHMKTRVENFKPLNQ